MLLHAAGFDVSVLPPDADETLSPGVTMAQAAMELAMRKLASVPASAGLRIAADTLVVLGTTPLGKPQHREDAVAMLTQLSGYPHEVVTGFAVARDGHQHSEAVRTKVWFRRLSALEIARYVDSGDPYDKAGAYAIQGEAGAFVDRIEGSYTNVVGLPVAEVLMALAGLP